mmetsp:Transcript_28711/g.66631  ORF Transcript_28711/g.66631 Transcript_28711/m.66631 type:complete len:364 (-) Transcript_28711:116-1207(-)|eukprot:CAMPEP_0178432396 /NCGR_PEP_ID=MMETSP0689_2-20121128/32358_1 /TAXON_ID=160604 /ORGANISM="Amphidinium massartii, Strain CS-259" /LENGTH=363 /DNA_ID=CAMNT_0020054371 /DNA_START=1 /DNA_END=1092 /DNA_ORIENTATION=+
MADELAAAPAVGEEDAIPDHVLASALRPAPETAGGPRWRCVIESREEVGQARRRHVEYQARLLQVDVSDGDPAAQAIRFRFSELVHLRRMLEQVPELADVSLPALPPKVTLRSMVFGNTDEGFQAARAERVQHFIEDLFGVLAAKYAEVGSFVELCEPLGMFVQSAAQRGDAAEAAAVAAAVRAQEAQEDRETRAQQDAEYEESLRRDREAEEARAKAVAEEAAAAAAQAEAAVEAERAAAEKLAALKERRAKFDLDHPTPASDVEQAAIRLRAPGGATLSRSFPANTAVSVLFEYAEVSDWPAAPVRKFDLRTTFPVKSLSNCKDLTLSEAALCPSAALFVAEEEDDEAHEDADDTASLASQ